MKRSGPLSRSTRLARRTEIAKLNADAKARRARRKANHYAAFRRSPVYLAVLRRSGGQCEEVRFHVRCKETESLEVHHVTYARFGGDELLEDLLVLCRRCHQQEESRLRGYRQGRGR